MMTEPAVEDLPLWHPREDLDPRFLANALEHIRRMSWAHFIGNAFDPDHMHAISAVAAVALCGEPVEPPVDMNSPQWREMIRERHEAWVGLCDDAVVEQARYEDGPDVDEAAVNVCRGAQ